MHRAAVTALAALIALAAGIATIVETSQPVDTAAAQAILDSASQRRTQVATADVLAHNNHALNHQLFTIAADIRVASDHIDRDRHALDHAQGRTNNLKEHARQLRARAKALSR